MITLCRYGCKMGKSCKHIDKYQCLNNECKKRWDYEIKYIKYAVYIKELIYRLTILKKFTSLLDISNNFPNEIIYFILDIYVDLSIILKTDMIKHCETKACHQFYCNSEEGALCENCVIDVCSDCADKWVTVKNDDGVWICNDCESSIRKINVIFRYG